MNQNSPKNDSPAARSGSLVTNPNLGDDTDDAYNEIVDAHKALTAEQGRIFQASMLLVLANHIGDIAVIRAAIEVSRQAAIAEAARQGED